MLLFVVILNNPDLPKLFCYKNINFYGNTFFQEKNFFRALSSQLDFFYFFRNFIQVFSTLW